MFYKQTIKAKTVIDRVETAVETMYLRYAAMWMDWRKRLIP